VDQLEILRIEKEEGELFTGKVHSHTPDSNKVKP